MVLILKKLPFYCERYSESESRSVVSDSLRPHGLYSPRNSPGQNTGVGSPSFLHWIFPTQGSNPGFLHCRWILYHLSHQGSPQNRLRFLYHTIPGSPVCFWFCVVCLDPARGHGIPYVLWQMDLTLYWRQIGGFCLSSGPWFVPGCSLNQRWVTYLFLFPVGSAFWESDFRRQRPQQTRTCFSNSSFDVLICSPRTADDLASPPPPKLASLQVRIQCPLRLLQPSQLLQ